MTRWCPQKERSDSDKHLEITCKSHYFICFNDLFSNAQIQFMDSSISAPLAWSSSAALHMYCIYERVNE